MVKKQQKQPVVLKPSKKITDSRRVRYGAGSVPSTDGSARMGVRQPGTAV